MLTSLIQCSQCHTHLSGRGRARELFRGPFRGRGSAPAPRAVRCRVCGRSNRTSYLYRRAWLARQLIRLLVVPTTLLTYLTVWVASINEGDDAVVAAFIALPAAAFGLAASYLVCQVLSVPGQLIIDAGHAAMRLVRRRGRRDARGASAGGMRALVMHGDAGAGEARLDKAAAATSRTAESCAAELRSAA